MPKKQRLKQGDFVTHYRSRKVYKVMEVDAHQATLIDAMNRWYGVYPLDELQYVRPERVIEVRQWEKKTT